MVNLFIFEAWHSPLEICLFTLHVWYLLSVAPSTTTRRPNPCYPSPCGFNADCTNRNGVAKCSCLPNFFGDPYSACERECTVNADCTRDKACKNFHCIDPCPGLCGANAICKVINHIPTCTCQQGYQGDPFTSCKLLPLCKKKSILDKTILSQILFSNWASCSRRSLWS